MSRARDRSAGEWNKEVALEFGRSVMKLSSSLDQVPREKRSSQVLAIQGDLAVLMHDLKELFEDRGWV